MLPPFIQAYLFLALRIDKSLRSISPESPLIDYYYGPQEWKAQVEAEPPLPAPQLLQHAGVLLESVPVQDLEPRRKAFLDGQLRALYTLCRKLAGETLTLQDELAGYFGLHQPLTLTPEADFEQTWANAEKTLPGTGDIQDRIEAFDARFTLPTERAEQSMDFLHQAMAEARRRTLTFVDLPPGETVTAGSVRGARFLANCHYE